MKMKIKEEKEEKTQAIEGKYMFHKFVKEVFSFDKEVHVSEFNELTNSFEIEVDEFWKANYLNMMIGGVNTSWDEPVYVYVHPSLNAKEVKPTKLMWETIFRGNKMFDRALVVQGELMTKVTVVVFKPEIVQIHCDNAFNPDGGIETYTYEQIVKCVFKGRGNTYVVFTTAKK